jgi:hypothetical protein
LILSKFFYSPNTHSTFPDSVSFRSVQHAYTNKVLITYAATPPK